MKTWFYDHMDNHGTHSFIGGTLSSFFAAINVEHSIGVIFYAGLGALVSYCASRILKKLFDKK